MFWKAIKLTRQGEPRMANKMQKLKQNTHKHTKKKQQKSEMNVILSEQITNILKEKR